MQLTNCGFGQVPSASDRCPISISRLSEDVWATASSSLSKWLVSSDKAVVVKVSKTIANPSVVVLVHSAFFPSSFESYSSRMVA